MEVSVTNRNEGTLRRGPLGWCFPGLIARARMCLDQVEACLTTRHRQGEKGKLNGLAPKKRRRKANLVNTLAEKVRSLEAEKRPQRKRRWSERFL